MEISRLVKKFCALCSVLIVLSGMLYAEDDPLFDAASLREEFYAGTFTGSHAFFEQQEQILLEHQPLTASALSTLEPEAVKNLIILKTVEAEYLHTAENLVKKKVDKKDEEKKSLLAKLKADNAAIITFVRKNAVEPLYYYAAEYSLAMIPVFGDGGNVYSMQASRFMRNTLRKNKTDTAAKVHYGTYIAYLIRTQRHTDIHNLTAFALRLLSDENIAAVSNRVLEYQAYCCKSAIYMKNFNSEKAYYYYGQASAMFPHTKLRHIAGISYHEAAEKHEAYRAVKFKTDMDMPYYVDAGLSYRSGDLEIFSPYIGIGLQRTFFSSAWFVQTGLKLSYKSFKWSLGFKHAFIPDFSVFNPHILEYYGENIFSVGLGAVTFSTGTKAGSMVFATNPLNGQLVKTNAVRLFAVKQNILCDFNLYNDGFNQISGLVEGGLYHLPFEQQTFGYVQAQLPATFHFGHGELGFLPQFVYADYMTENRRIHGLNRHSIYRSSIQLIQKQSLATDFCNRFYHITGNIDGTYRFFFSPLKAPADRLYVGLHSSIGFGTDKETLKTDMLYTGGISFGFALYDLRPFELRFQVDQDKNVFFMMTVMNPIRHKK